MRTFQARDADAWVEMFSDPEVTRFLPPGPRHKEIFQTQLSARHAMEAELGYAMWAVEEKATGTFIGQCGLRPAATMDPSGRLGNRPRIPPHQVGLEQGLCHCLVGLKEYVAERDSWKPPRAAPP